MNGDPTGPGNTGGGPPKIDVCAPLKTVIVTVTNCKTGQAITIFTASDSLGNILPVNGTGQSFYVCCAPGYQYKVTAGGFEDLTFAITQQDVSTGFKTVCLTPKPPSQPTHPCAHICCFSFSAIGLAAFGLASPEEGESLTLATTLRHFRDTISSTKLGEDLVNLYYDERFSKPVAEALRRNPSLSLNLMVLLLDLWPLISSFAPDDNVTGCSAAAIPTLKRPKQILTPRAAAAIERWLSELTQKVPSDVQERLNRIKAVVRLSVGRNAGLIVHDVLQGGQSQEGQDLDSR